MCASASDELESSTKAESHPQPTGGFGQRVESEDRYRALVESLDVAFCIIQVLFDDAGHPFNYRYLEANPAFERHTGMTNAIGKTVRDFVTDDHDRWLTAYGEVATSGAPISIEDYVPSLDRWFEVHAQRVGNAEDRNVAVFFTDISDRKKAEVALQESEERLRQTQTQLSSALLAGNIGTWSWDIVADRIVGDAITNRLFSVPTESSAKGVSREAFFYVIYPDDRPRVADAIRRAIGGEDQYTVEHRVVLPDGSLRWLEARARVQRDENGRAVSLPGLVVDVTERIERDRREKLLNQIGAAVRAELKPDAILQAAFIALGECLNADRCYFVRYNDARDRGFISDEWFREGIGLEPIAGTTRRMSQYSVNRDPDFQSGRSQVVDDTEAYAPDAAAPLLALKLRALVRIPIVVGDQTAALGVAMAYEPRRWTDEDIRLIENVATLVRSALESAHVQQRERNIARQLQEALVPAPPSSVPGLLLAHYYRSALQESSVGGDFFDVFNPREDVTALVVADLSGKGLAAASQTSLVRNMLRFVLYSERSLADSILSLHRILVDHNLLTGFATLFAGLFDQKNRTLTYVNCGQEPALVFRCQSQTIERLGTTGPVLGGFVADGFEQKTVALAAGDVIVLFTDGLTEIGPSRKNLLEVDGVCDMLDDCCSDPRIASNPDLIVQKLIVDVDAFASGGIADDIAMLVGVVA